MTTTRHVALDGPIELSATLAPLRRGPYDPSITLSPTECWRATHTPAGPGTERLRVVPGGVEVEAFGPGAEVLLDQAPALLGAHDTRAEFAPADARVATLHRRYRGLRLTTAGNPVELMVPTILEQKVTSIEAHRSYARLVRAHGTPAPGPVELVFPPSPAELVALPSFAWHACGVERRRAETIREVCGRAAAIERLAAKGSEEFQARVQSLPGIGVWTATSVALVAFGDPDAVVVGDFHLPAFVAWNLVGEREADDARMLELLEPFRPHRARVVALLGREGSHAPRRAPKRAPRDIRRI
ncbi:MAG: DNA-3-methyladenine glycosylase 2 family protein [Acidimicrobiia bacterium]|nr:DNA-3-methyladenine glycosylase 2 family protein [Acidimicrobiia bacterium]